MDEERAKKDPPRLPEGTGKNALEWVVFAVSLVLIVSAAAVLLVQGGRMDESPPDLDVRLGTPEAGHGWTRVPVTVYNRGGRAAENVEVAVTLEEEGMAATCTFDFIPRQGKREGAVGFRTQSSGNISVRAVVVGHSDP